MSGGALWVGVALAGGLGALARLNVGALVAARASGAFPWGTMAVNLTAALLAGLVHGLDLADGTRVVVSVGVLGAFSTFSTWMLDTVHLQRAGRRRAAAANLAIALIAGAALAGLGWWVGEALAG